MRRGRQGALERGDGAHVPVDEQRGVEPLLQTESRNGEHLEDRLHPPQTVRAGRHSVDRGVQEPRMGAVAGVDGEGPEAQPVLPALRGTREGRRRTEGDVDHRGDDLVAGTDVPVRRHRAHTEALREFAHRHPFQALVVR